MIERQDIDGYLLKRDRTAAFILNQHDAGVKFRVNLFQAEDKEYILSENETVTIEWRKPNKHAFLQTEGITKGTNYVEFTVDKAITQFVGLGFFNIIIKDGELRKGTLKREFEVVETGLGEKEVSQSYLDNQLVDVLDDLYEDFKDLKSKFNDHVKNHPGGSGGGGGGVSTPSIISSLETTNYKSGEIITIPVFFTSPNSGAGKIVIMVDDIEKVNTKLNMGDNTYNIEGLEKGTHKISLYAIDSLGIYSNKITHTVNVGSLEISSIFNFNKDYSTTAAIKMPLTIDTISTDNIVITYKIGAYTYTMAGEKGYNAIVFPSLAAGIYKIEVYAVAGEYTSNVITGNLVVLAGDNLFVSTMTEQDATFEEGTTIQIDYRISMKNVNNFNVTVNLDNELYKKLTVKGGTNYLTLIDLKKGTHTIEFVVTDINETQTYTLVLKIYVKESSFEAIESVKQGLLCWFDARGKDNTGSDRNVWEDKSGNDVKVNLHGLNYKTNGWMDNGLQLDGASYAEVEMRPFEDDAEYGLTIDIQYMVENTGNENAKVFDCRTAATSEVGIYADVNEISLTSMSQTKKTPHSEGELIRATYVIDRERQLAQIYINAVMSETMFLDDSDSSLESFQHSNTILLNTNIDKKVFGRVKIYNLRVYDRALTHDEILKNHISDLSSRAEQQSRWNFNYNDNMPTMYLYGDVTSMTKKTAVPLRIKYISTDTSKYGQSFDLDGSKSMVSWQGTSSLQYAVKNYKLKLKDNDGNKYKHALYEGQIETSTFCLKADYMESSHMNNTGIANFTNDNLYSTPNPPQQDNEKVRTAIGGFPIKLYINDLLMGVFNFNLDKGSTECYGMTDKYPNCLSMEVVANTDTTGGAFCKWTEESEKTKLAYYQSDFEIRYAADEEDETIWDCIAELVEWVSDADDETFAAELEQHFNKEYLIRYYLTVMVFGMVDNLGKNMMLNTWDRKIWYPNFYDNDTALGLNNSGYLVIESDCEIQAGIFNTSKSKLWTKLARVFDADIKETYKNMRSGLFRLDNMYEYFITNQIDKIPERLYNLDAEVKYIPYKRVYAHMIHGSRREHIKKWLRERILYLDSLLGYDEQLANFITIRANKEGPVSLDISTYSPLYLTVKWRNGELQTKRVGRNKTVTFSSSIPTETDQEVLIYAADQLKTIDGISNLTPSALMMSNATRLTKLECKSEKLLSVSVENNKLLQVINLKGCTLLGTGTVADIDVSACVNLIELNLSSTQITKIVFNKQGSNLQKLSLSDTLKNLELVNMPNLREVNTTYYSKLTSLKVADMTIETKEAISKLLSNSIEKIDFDTMYLKTLNFSNMKYLRDVNITNSEIDEVYYPVKELSEFDSYYFEDAKVISAVYTMYKDFSTEVLDKSETQLKALTIIYGDMTLLNKCYVLPDTLKKLIFKQNTSHTTKFKRGIYFGSDTTHDTSYTDIDFNNKELDDLSLSDYQTSNIYNLNLKAHNYVLSLYRDVIIEGIIDYTNLENVNDFSNMFYGYLSSNTKRSNLTIIPPAEFNTGGSALKFNRTFANCNKLEESEVISLVSSIPIAKVWNMNSMFANTGYNIKNIFEAFSNINASISIPYFFSGNTCTGALGDVNVNFGLSWNDGMFENTKFTSGTFNFNKGIETLNSMFESAALTSATLNIAKNINSSTKITNMDDMCSNCTNLESLDIKVTYANTINIITTASYAFTNCTSLTHFTVENLQIDCDVFKSLPSSVVLDSGSLLSIAKALVSHAGGDAKEISLSSSLSNMNEECMNLLSSKNWEVI